MANLQLKRVVVAFTPLAGALAFPVAVPLVLRSAGLPAALLTAVGLGTVWFVLMLRSAEMPAEH
ncbi:MAG: hypothetical protein KFB97_02530 [Cyanobium sp. M30B3]|nr:MAG: hypothetical protein KFB97_02530 [Cyanobium sp. M30B3]